jgi:GMP synthase (glutamine-hydrolysing)
VNPRTPRPIAVLVLGTTVETLIPRRGDFADWFLAGLRRHEPDQAVEVHAIWRGAPLPDAERLAGAVLTGSGAMLTERAPWSEATVAWLRSAVPAGLPVLGVCYGHQALAAAFGGQVNWNPRGREVGTVEVERLPAALEHPLFADLPARFGAQATHSQSVVQLPPGAACVGSSALDPHQAFALSERAVGVQFHPEFDADILRGYLSHRGEELGAEGLDVALLERSLVETPEAADLLPRFTALCRRWRG